MAYDRIVVIQNAQMELEQINNAIKDFGKEQKPNLDDASNATWIDFTKSIFDESEEETPIEEVK